MCGVIKPQISNVVRGEERRGEVIDPTMRTEAVGSAGVIVPTGEAGDNNRKIIHYSTN